jgi:hypothetical protein
VRRWQVGHAVGVADASSAQFVLLVSACRPGHALCRALAAAAFVTAGWLMIRRAKQRHTRAAAVGNSLSITSSHHALW